MTEQPSRIEDAKQRALDAKQKIGIAAAAAFVGIFGLAWASHSGSPSASSAGASATNQSTFDEGGSPSAQDDNDFGGFNSFGSIAPSGGAAPQAQTHVS